MRKMTKKFLSLAMSAVMAVSVCPAVNASETREEDNPVVLRFIVASDTHMLTSTCTEATRFKKMFESAYKYAGEQLYNRIDAAILVGDIVDRGRASEYTELQKTMNACNVKDETQIYMTMGNHEWWSYTNDKENGTNGTSETGKKTFLEGLSNISQIDNVATDDYGATEFSVNINGYQFIGMSPENYNDGCGHDVYGTDKYTWMKNEVDKAKSNDATKPIFTFQHHPVKDTVYGSGLAANLVTGTDEQNALDNCYKDTQQVINFSGHSHSPINTPTAINQTTYTQYTTGSMTSIYLENDASTGRQPNKASLIGQYTIVEVTKDNNVRLIPYNILSDGFFESPLGETDAIKSDLIYEINVNDKDSWKYTTEKREKNVPYFDSDDKVTYKAGKITIDQAKDDTGVYLYEIEVKSEDKTTKTRKIFSDWYYAEMPSKLTYELDMLEVGESYTVNVYPIDFFKNRGEAITTTFIADDIVEKIEEPEVYNKEHFEKGNFEEKYSTFVGNAEWSKEKAYEGEHSVKLTQSQDQLVVNVYSLEGDKKYEVSMWMYVPNNAAVNATFQLGIVMTNQDDWKGFEGKVSHWVPITNCEKGKWFQYKFTFEYPSGADIAQFTVASMSTNSIAYIDNFSVKRYHNCQAVDVEGYAPTYDKEGMKPGKKCPICGKVFEGCESIPKLVRPTTTTPQQTTAKPQVTTTTTKTLKAKIKKIDTKKLKSKKLCVKLTRIKGAKKYEIQVSTSKKFKKVLVKKTTKKITYTFNDKKLKNKKKLYVRARVQGSKFWTKAKSVKIKK